MREREGEREMEGCLKGKESESDGVRVMER